MLSNSYDLVAFSETWFSDGVQNSELGISSIYSVYRSDRNFHSCGVVRGGGVLLAVHDNLKSHELSLPMGDSQREDLRFFDLLAVRIKLGGEWLCVIVCYIQPGQTLSNYNTFFDVLMNFLSSCNDELLLMGDFNIPEFHSVSRGRVIPTNLYRSAVNFMSFCKVRQYNNLLNAKDRVLDFICSTREVLVSEAYDPITRVDPLHPPVEFDFPCQTNASGASVATAGQYNFKRANFVDLYNEMLETDWMSGLCVIENADEAVEAFYLTLYAILDKHVPRKKSFRSRSYPPWFNGVILASLKDKQRAHKEWKSSGDRSTYDRYNFLRQKLKREISLARKAYLNHVEDRILSEPSDFWSLVGSQRRQVALPNVIKSDDTEISGPQNVVNAFAKHFSEAFSTPRDLVGGARPSADIVGELTVGEVDRSTILRCMRKIGQKLTMGPDMVPSFLLYDCREAFAEPLCYIFNLILKTSDFPSKWKVSRVRPVHKAGKRSDISNYRPVAIICNFAKLFEHVLKGQVENFSASRSSPRQHGFVKGRSTITNLVCMTQYIAESIDKRGQVDVIYADISKAFDRLDHQILLRKLHFFGFSNSLVLLFKSYLADRTQYIGCGGYSSNSYRQISGVPQGSVLGPLLFNIFINDVVDVLDSQCYLYADDLKIFSSITNRTDCDCLQKRLLRLNEWCKLNNLLLNPGKCKVMTFARIRAPILFHYTLNQTILERPAYVRDLGVHFDSQLTFIPHIDYIVNRAFARLGIIVRNSLDLARVETFSRLFCALVRPILEYGSVVWSPIYCVHSYSLERVQRRFLKFMSFKLDGVYPPRGMDNQLLLDRFEWFSLETRRQMFSVLFLYDLIHHNLVCDTLDNYLVLREPVPSIRHRFLFRFPQPNTNVMVASPLYQMLRNYDMVSRKCNVFTASKAVIRSCFISSR